MVMLMELYLFAVEIKNSGNLGALARVCDNFNVEKLVLINPQCTVDDYAYERATKSRRYLDNVMIFNTLEEAKQMTDLLIGLSARVGGTNNLRRSSLPITTISSKISNIQGPVALVLGREDHGLSNEEVAICDMLVNIPLPGDNPVMNISHAAAVALWEIIRVNTYPSPHHFMKREEKNAFLTFLSDILKHAWIDPESHEQVIRLYTHLLSRSLLTTREANGLIGSMRGIYRSLVGPHPPWDPCPRGGRNET